MFCCIFQGKIQGGLRCSIFKNFQVKIIHNLSLHFWHNTFREPRTFPGTRLGPGLWNYYILASSVLNFIPLNALFLSILILSPVRLIMWEVLIQVVNGKISWMINTSLVTDERFFKWLCPPVCCSVSAWWASKLYPAHPSLTGIGSVSVLVCTEVSSSCL